MKALGITGIIIGMIVLSCVNPVLFGAAALIGGIALVAKKR